MASQAAIERAAQAWCQPKASHVEMDVDLAEAFAEIINEDMHQLAMVDEALARRPRLDAYTTRYQKIFALCSAAGRMEAACLKAQNFLMSKARRDPQEREIVRLLAEAVYPLERVTEAQQETPESSLAS